MEMMRKEPSEPRGPWTAQGLFGPARRRDEVKPSLKDLKGPWLAQSSQDQLTKLLLLAEYANTR